MKKPHISLRGEPIFEILNFNITNSFLSSIIVLFLFFLIALYYQKESQKTLEKRSSAYFFINFIVKTLYNFFGTILGDDVKQYFSLLASFFIFILLQNWFGLLPGIGSILIAVKEHESQHFIPLLRGGTADLNTTIILGLISVILTNIASINALGFRGYIARFYRLKDPMSFFIGTLEVVSEISKVISFAFRLFGNIFAGEVLLSVIAFLVPVIAAFPFLLLEIFVGFIQALVFSTLTAVFIGLATESHH